MWDLGGLAQQLPNKRDALAALWFFAERAIHYRHGAARILDMGAKVAIGDRVAKTDIHSRPCSKLMPFI
jgi:hypothetical protein